MRTIPNRIKSAIKDWIKQHDRAATHYKLWSNGDSFRFQCCIGQEPYGHLFTIDTDLRIATA